MEEKAGERVTTVGGSGAVNVFGGQLTIQNLSLLTNHDGETATASKLDSLKDMFRTNYLCRCEMGVSLTRKMQEALNYLINSFSVVIHGRPGEGKTVCAYRLAKELVQKGLIRIDRCALLCEPQDIKQVNSDNVDLIFIDNIFGKHNADPSKLSNWRSYFETLESLTLNRVVRVIVASRMHILMEYKPELDACKIFANKVELNSTELSNDEKRNILKCQLSCFKRYMDEGEIEKCILLHTSEVGFPLCSQLFASNDKMLLPKAEFFKPSYLNFLDTSLRALDSEGLVALVNVFCAGNQLKRTDLSIAKISESSKVMLSRISQLYGINMPVESLVRETKRKIEMFVGSYLVEMNGNISFLHETIYEAIARLMLKDCPTEVISSCTTDFLCQCVCLENTGNDMKIVVETEDLESLATRGICEVIDRHNGKKLAKHPMLRNNTFVEVLFEHLTSSEECLRDFFSVGVTLKSEGIHGFLYHVLMNDQMNEVFFSHACQHLCCYHTSVYEEACWKCQVKQEALAAACGSNKQDAYKELRDEDARVTDFCLFKAVENPAVDPELVLKIIDDLKESNSFILDNVNVQMSLGLSMRHADDKVFKILKSNGARATVHFLYFAVQKGDAALLSSTLHDLIKEKRWKADNYYVSRAILEAQITNKQNLLNIMSAFGARLHDGAVYWAVVDHGYDEVINIVHMLKKANAFDCESHHLAWALAVAGKNKDRRIYDFLRSEGVVATPTLVAAMSELGESAEKIQEVIKELQKDGKWEPENRFITSAYMAASKRANKSLQDLLATEGVGMCSGCFYYAVIWYVCDVEKIMTFLKSRNLFDPLDINLARTLVWSTEYRDESYVKWLLDVGLCFNMACLIAAVERSFSLSTLEIVIDNIKSCDKWNTSCDHALEALNAAWNRQDKTVYEILMNEGIEWAPRNLIVATQNETLEELKQVLLKMDEKHMLDSSCSEIQVALSLAKSFKNRQKYREIRKFVQH